MPSTKAKQHGRAIASEMRKQRDREELKRLVVSGGLRFMLDETPYWNPERKRVVDAILDILKQVLGGERDAS